MRAQVMVHQDAESLAGSSANRLTATLAEAQAARGSASVVVTGGRIGIAVLAAVAALPTRDTVDWARVDVWWGDERFLPAGHPDRNETQARTALLDHLPLTPSRVHPMPACDGPDGPDVDAAAERYARDLHAAASEDAALLPRFDVLMLGVGPDAHVASLFPGQPGVGESDRTVIGVHDAPKPPPTRISLTLPTIAHAREVWLLASGDEKADAVSAALRGADAREAPAAAAHGSGSTLWLIDRAAARSVPHDLV